MNNFLYLDGDAAADLQVSFICFSPCRFPIEALLRRQISPFFDRQGLGKKAHARHIATSPTCASATPTTISMQGYCLSTEPAGATWQVKRFATSTDSRSAAGTTIRVPSMRRHNPSADACRCPGTIKLTSWPPSIRASGESHHRSGISPGFRNPGMLTCFRGRTALGDPSASARLCSARRKWKCRLWQKHRAWPRQSRVAKSSSSVCGGSIPGAAFDGHKKFEPSLASASRQRVARCLDRQICQSESNPAECRYDWRPRL